MGVARIVVGLALLAAVTAAQDTASFDPLRGRLAGRRTKNFLVLRHGRIVYEWYTGDSGFAKPHYTASLAKALVGGMSLLLALQDGRMRVDDPAWRYIPAWKADPLRSRITIRHLATHSSGIEDAEEDHKLHDQLGGWKGAFWRREPDPFSIALRDAPVVFTPGSKYAYSNPGMAALAYAVTASLRGAPQPDIRALLKARILDVLGVPEAEWSIGYGRAYEVDGLSLYANWGGGSFTARAAARIGQLMLQRGEWRGQRLLAPEWVARAVSYAGTPLPDRPPGNPQPASGLAWYTNYDGVWPAVPRDAIAGAGAGHQVLLVVPSLGLVAVRNGGILTNPGEPEGFWGALEKHLFNPLMEAVASQPPYPPSAAIAGVEFAPAASITRAAPGSDNWPITWADDDELFTAYGDGWGFEPRTERKLSLGLARVLGSAETFRAENVRSPSGEREGDGPRGPKASGLLMLDGVLFMWVRNTGNAQLAWSEDRGRTWHWGFRFEQSFSCPAFLNFGQNYAGARDRWVYAYSADGASAYESYDRVVLARAPGDRIRERAAWEFVERLDAAGRPVWTRELGRRGTVFRYPRHCQRLDVVYNAGLRRYLLLLGYNHSSGWGIFDAPEPWGPWTTAFHTETWDLPGTHGYRLPTKWIALDGRSAWLVFSGTGENDAFCLRQVRFKAPGRQ